MFICGIIISNYVINLPNNRSSCDGMSTELAILAKELYQHFGSVRSRKFTFYTFVYAFVLGCTANFAASFLASLVDREWNIALSGVSTFVLVILALLLVFKQHLILGAPKSFHQSFILTSKDKISSSDAKDVLLKAVKPLITDKFELSQKDQMFNVKKKRIFRNKSVCTIAQRRSSIQDNIEFKIDYSNDDQGERFSESLNDNLYFESIKKSMQLIVDNDSRPFGKLLIQARFDLVNEVLASSTGKK